MTRRPVPQTVQSARKFTNRFGIAFSAFMLGGLGAWGGLISMVPENHEKVAVLGGLAILMAVWSLPFFIWGERLQSAQRIVGVWSKIESEETEAELVRQLRRESALATPAHERLRQMARASTLQQQAQPRRMR